MLFDPTVPEHLKGKVLDKNGRVIGRTNQTNAIYVGDYRKENCTRMKHFTKEDIDKGVFLPCAGAYTEYNDGAPRLQRPSAQALTGHLTASHATTDWATASQLTI